MKLVVLALAALLLAGCGASSKPQVAEALTTPRDEMAVVANKELMTQIKIGVPSWDSVTATMRVSGRVEANETRTARVSSPVTGRITELDVLEGQTVKRGQLLAVIRSTELADAQFGYLRARSQQQLALRAVDRAKRLLEAGVIGEAELQRREAELSQASAELSSSRDQLRVLGMSDDATVRLEQTRTVNAVSQVLASIDGTVMQRAVTLGQVVQQAETILVLADLSTVWLVADVPEQTSGTLSVGKQVEAEIAALPGEIIRGSLSFVSAIVNPETRTVRARMDLANPDRKYKPAMLATMTLQDSAAREQVVPMTAIVREDNQEYVFVQTGDNTFVLRPVALGGEFGKIRVLKEGVRPGEKIVLDGAFHLNNERKRLALQGT